MPFVYATVPGVNIATSATPNTEVNHLRTLTVAARAAWIMAIYLIGKGAGLTVISGIAIRLKRFATPSTVGTAITPNPRDPGSPAARLTAFTAPTSGATPLLQKALGMGAAGPGGWVARDQDSPIAFDAGGGANGNVDLFSSSGTASLNFEYEVKHSE